MTHPLIEMNPEVLGGEPVIRGTRIPVELVRLKLRTGMTAEQILADHPRLTMDDVRAIQELNGEQKDE